MRREFQLVEEDEDCLDASGLEWEAVVESNVNWILIHDFPIPEGYNTPSSDVALRIEPSYPDTEIDMMYFRTHLSLATGTPIGALAVTEMLGSQFQRWSRHRTGQNPWRPGVDNVGTHLVQIAHWLKRELAK